MKKKILFVLTIFIIFFSLGWYSIGNENTYIIKFKDLLPLKLRNNLKNSIFIVPKLIQENKNLKAKINQLNSSVNAGLNFNDEVFPSKYNWYGIRKFYLPFNTSYFPIKKKSFLFRKNENIFVIFESGKLISFSKNDFNKNKLFFQNYNSNLEYEFINNERDEYSRILNIKENNNNLFISLIKKKHINCYELAIVFADLTNLSNLKFQKIYEDKNCINKNKKLEKDFGKINFLKDNLIVNLDKNIKEFDLTNYNISSDFDFKHNYKIFTNSKFLIKYLNQENNFLYKIFDLKMVTNKNLFDNSNLQNFNILKNNIQNIFDIRKIDKKKYEIAFLQKKMEEIFIYEINLNNQSYRLIDHIKLGKIPEKISDIIRVQEKEFLITFEKDPSIGLLSINVKQ